MSILFIHGSLSSGAMWRRAVAALEPAHCATPDLPGALGGPPSDGNGSPLAEDLAVLQALLVGLPPPVTLVAHSYGGLLAFHLAAANPGRVANIVAHEPVCWMALPLLGTPEDAARFYQDPVVTELSNSENGGTDGWLQAFLEFWNGPDAWTHLPARVQDRIRASGNKVYREVVLGAMADEVAVEHALALRIPIRMTVGTEAPAIERRVLELLEPRLHDAELVEVPGGHLAPITHGTDVFAVWKRWIPAER